MPLYATHAAHYKAAGWPCVVPLPPNAKTPPPEGFTGADGRDTTIAEIAQLAHDNPDGNLALRLPDGVIGIDVDHYDKVKVLPDGTQHVVRKRGHDVIRELEETLGPLPPTWMSTARAWPTGIRLYRVPVGRYRTTIGDAIEVIQRHHRYVVAWPSTNPDAGGAQYGWHLPRREDDRPEAPWTYALVRDARVPQVSDLPELAPAWVEFLREGAAGESTPLGAHHEGASMLTALQHDARPACADSAQAAERALRKMRSATEGSRHDAMTSAVHDVVHVGAKGHPGAWPALAAIAELWEEQTAGEHRAEELDRAVLSSARKAVTLVRSPEPVPTDPCLIMPGTPRLAGDFGGNGRPVEPDASAGQVGLVEVAESGELPVSRAVASPPRGAVARALIGAEPFDPRETHDQLLAHRALERLYPVLRYASDVGAWLCRRPDRWELLGPGPIERWGLHLLAELMPLGDPEADKASDEYRRHERRSRFLSGTRVSGVASKMRDAVAVGDEHYSALRLADLDADPDVLWAGGVPWNLRRAEPAQWIDPDAPHLHACAVAPADVPTPRWDAFLRAVLPDPEVRAWALRVLGVALTGYADRALPIFWGDHGRGKTQLVVLVMSLLGSYAHAADPRLLSNPDGTHASIVFALKGRRLSFIDEGPRRGEQATERLKQVTGGGDITGNPMRGNPVSFTPTHTLVLTSNPPPGVTDEALRSRVRLIPCEGDVDAVRRARAAITGEAWQQEGPGVLLSLMREAAGWLGNASSAGNESSPAVVRQMVADIVAEQDPVAQWLSDAVTPSDQGTRALDLYQSFVAWCRGMGYRNVPNVTAWGRALSEAGYPAERRRDANYRPLAPRGPGGWPGASARAADSSTDVRYPPSRNDAFQMTEGSGPPTMINGGGSAQLGGQSVGGFSADPPQPVLPVQPLSLSSFVDSVDSTHSPIEEKREEDTHTENIERKSTAHVPTPSELSTETPLTSGNVVEAPSTGASTALHTAKKPRRTRMTPEEKAARAAERKAIKDAARAAARAEAVEAASGPVVGLPALWRRDGGHEAVDFAGAQAELVRQVTERGELTVDVESNGFPVGHGRHELRTIQLGDEDAALVLDAADPQQRALAGAALAAAPVLRAFSAAADLVPLAHAGVVDPEDAWPRMHDQTIPAKLDQPAGVQNGSDLKNLSKARLGEHAQSPAADAARDALFKAGGWDESPEHDAPTEKSGWAQADHRRATMQRYDASDVLDCAALARVIPLPPPDIYARERRVEHVVSRVAHVGLAIDRGQVEELLPREEQRLAEARERLMTRGVDNGKSPKQVGEWLMARGITLPPTRNGNPSTAEGVLENLRHVLPEDSDALPFITDVLDYREHATALGLFLRPWRDLCAHGDGRSRSTVYTLGAATGRMSCVRFNLQQITREGGYRACMVADPGTRIVSADFSSVEVRVMAALSGDPTLRKLVLDYTAWEATEHPEGARNPYDLHNVVADMAFGPEWTKRDRYMVKRGVFGWAYGGSVTTLAAQVGCSEGTMAMIVDSLAAIAPEYVAWSDEVKRHVRAGAIEFPTYSGRIIKLDRRLPHKAPNYLIQGTARELLVDALLRWDQGPHGGGVVVPVHDEILAVVPEDRAQDAQDELVRCMTTELHGVPIGAGVDEQGPSTYWRDAA